MAPAEPPSAPRAADAGALLAPVVAAAALGRSTELAAAREVIARVSGE